MFNAGTAKAPSTKNKSNTHTTLEGTPITRTIQMKKKQTMLKRKKMKNKIRY